MQGARDAADALEFADVAQVDKKVVAVSRQRDGLLGVELFDLRLGIGDELAYWGDHWVMVRKC